MRLLLVAALACCGCARQLADLYPEGPPPAPTLTVVDLRDADLDLKLAMTTLQGQVNRGGHTELYLVFWDHDLFWLDRLEQQGAIVKREASTPEQALARFADRYDRVFVCDPGLPASVNVATMIASLERGIVAAPAQAALLADGRETVDLAGRWATAADAYDWAFRTLWPRMNHRVLACYHPTSVEHHLRDYLTAHRVFHLWVTARERDAEAHATEKTVLERVLAETRPNIPVLGFWYSGADPGLNEYDGVGLAGQYGKFTVVSDWCSNLSVLGGVPTGLDASVAAYRERLQQRPPVKKADTVYLCVDIVESGDSPSYVETRQREVWADPARGSVPINWSLGAPVLGLMPPVAAYYYDTAAPADYIYTAISGLGYAHPYRGMMSRTPAPGAAWREYLRLTGAAMEQMGCRELGLYTDAWRRFDRARMDPVTRRFAGGMPQVDALVLGMGRDEGVEAEPNYVVDEVVVSHVLTRWPTDYAGRDRESNIAWLVEDIRAHTPEQRPAFLHVMALSWVFGPSEIAEVLRRLGPGYTPALIPEYNRLYRDWTAGEWPATAH